MTSSGKFQSAVIVLKITLKLTRNVCETCMPPKLKCHCGLDFDLETPNSTWVICYLYYLVMKYIFFSLNNSVSCYFLLQKHVTYKLCPNLFPISHIVIDFSYVNKWSSLRLYSSWQFKSLNNICLIFIILTSEIHEICDQLLSEFLYSQQCVAAVKSP